MTTRLTFTLLLVLNGISSSSFAEPKFVKIYSHRFSGIVVGSEDTKTRAIGNLLKITGKDCISGNCKPCRRMTQYIGLNVGHMSPGGHYKAQVEKEFISQNDTETQSVVLFRIANGIASNIGSVFYNDEFGFCDVTIEIGNSSGVDCKQTPDSSPELGKSNRCVARRFEDVQSPNLEILETSSQAESKCVLATRLKNTICNKPELNNIEDYNFYCK